MISKEKLVESLKFIESGCRIFRNTIEKYPEKSLKDQCSRLIDLIICETEILDGYVNGQE